jgi:hypothetical protein
MLALFWLLLLKIISGCALCPMIIEQPDMSAILAKTRYDRSSQQPSQVSLNAIYHLCLANEAVLPANRTYSYT